MDRATILIKLTTAFILFLFYLLGNMWLARLEAEEIDQEIIDNVRHFVRLTQISILAALFII